MARLIPAGGFHLGDQVNQFRYGSLAMQLQDTTAKKSDQAMETEEDAPAEMPKSILVSGC